jgi:hypothetical protein
MLLIHLSGATSTGADQRQPSTWEVELSIWPDVAAGGNASMQFLPKNIVIFVVLGFLPPFSGIKYMFFLKVMVKNR